MKSLKKFLIIMFLLSVIFTTNISFATQIVEDSNRQGKIVKNSLMVSDGIIDSTIKGADDFISKAETDKVIDDGKLQTNIKDIYNIVLAIGTVIAVIWGLIIGINFMLGSVEEKAQVKESLISYIIGCVIIFGAFGLWKIVMVVLERFG